MIPIREAGRTVGFGGRLLEGESEAKYLNSPDTPLYTKGGVLFALDKARVRDSEDRRPGQLALVSGAAEIAASTLDIQALLGSIARYVQRAIDSFPKQGSKRPWRLYQNYARDLVLLRHGSVDDAMEFSDPEPAPAVEEPLAA